MVIWFTGLSGSGKSTLSLKVVSELKRRGTKVEYLDGDEIRLIFPQTGFDRNSRNENVKRVGLVASYLEKNNIAVVASLISPYEESRQFVRSLCKNFIEVYVSTPVEVCEKRDVKGLYAKARRGEIPNFTGVSDPYEVPKSPEIAIDTSQMNLEKALDLVMEKILARNSA